MPQLLHSCFNISLSLIASCTRHLNFKLWNVLPNNDMPNNRMTLSSNASISDVGSSIGGKAGGSIDQEGEGKRMTDEAVSCNIPCTASPFGFGFPG